MTLPSIILIAVLVTFLGCLIYRKQKVTLTTKEKWVIFIVAIVLLLLSLLISKTGISGTIELTSYGWPHAFLDQSIRDIISNQNIGHWSLQTRAVLYIMGNYLFYLSFIFLGTVLMKSYKKAG